MWRIFKKLKEKIEKHPEKVISAKAVLQVVQCFTAAGQQIMQIKAMNTIKPQVDMPQTKFNVESKPVEAENSGIQQINPIDTTDSYSPITMKTDSDNTAQLSKNLSALNGRITECEDAIRETELAISSNNVDIRFAKNGTAMMHPSDVPLLEKRAVTLAEHMTQLKTEKAELVSQHNQLMEKIYK